MLNKELLLGSIQGQRKVECTIGYYHSDFTGSVYGYRTYDADDDPVYGSLDILPYWGTTRGVMKGLFYQQNYTYFEAPNGVTVFMKGYTHALSSGSNNSIEHDVYNMYNFDGGKVRYLTFDPPPRRLSGPKNTKTTLGKGYYVEGEDPWEAQDAEQGNASYLCTRNRSKDHSRGISQTWRSRGCANVLQLYGLRSDSHCPIASPSSQRENSDVLHYPSKEYRGVVHWRNKRFRGHNSDSFGCRNSDRHGSRCPSTYSGQLHNQWIRVHVLNEKEALYA